MSTRGAVGVGTVDNWTARYNHWDSYPTGLGAHVWEELRKWVLSGKTVQAFCDELMKYDDWRNFLAGGICEYCGKKTTQPHSISGEISDAAFLNKFAKDGGWDKDEFEKQWMEATYSLQPTRERIAKAWARMCRVRHHGAVDPTCKYHKHETMDSCFDITNTNGDPLFIEWVYVIDPVKMKMYILTHQSLDKGLYKAFGKNDGVSNPVQRGEWTDYGHCAYRHALVKVIDLASVKQNWNTPDKPNWKYIEHLGDIREQEYEKVAERCKSKITKKVLDNR